MSGSTALLTSYLGGQLGNMLSKPLENLTSSISNTVLKNVTYNSLCNAATGFALGTGFSLINGNGFDLSSAFGAGLESAGMGFLTGVKQVQNEKEQSSSNKSSNYGLPENVAKETLNSLQTPTGSGTNSVYVGRDADGNVRYVGITERDPQIRFNEHLKSGTNRSKLQYKTIDGTGKLSRIQSRIIEQNLINMYGLGKNNGILFNIRNSISPLNWNKYGIKNK